jgi:hypothetical protein
MMLFVLSVLSIPSDFGINRVVQFGPLNMNWRIPNGSEFCRIPEAYTDEFVVPERCSAALLTSLASIRT